jgi:hypothetical protein
MVNIVLQGMSLQEMGLQGMGLQGMGLQGMGLQERGEDMPVNMARSRNEVECKNLLSLKFISA